LSASSPLPKHFCVMPIPITLPTRQWEVLTGSPYVRRAIERE
jgi:hypothetical protein